MRGLIQRVLQAKVSVDDTIVGQIGEGMLIFLGIHHQDEAHHAEALAKKLVELRIFADEKGKMNLSLKELQKEALVVSQFTLYGDCQHSRRPDFGQAAAPEKALTLYTHFVAQLQYYLTLKVQTGQFGKKMAVSLINDGPVTFLVEK